MRWPTSLGRSRLRPSASATRAVRKGSRPHGPLAFIVSCPVLGWPSEQLSQLAGGRDDGRKMKSGPLLLAVPLSLSGRYAFQGRLAAIGLVQAVNDVARLGGVSLGDRRAVPEVAIVDDESTRAGTRQALEKIARAHLLFGPYGSDLVREAARWVGQKGRVLWNHGGSADDVQRLPGVISVASPASNYFPPILEALAQSLPQARVLLAVGRGSFPEEVAKGARDAANRLGMDVVTVAHGEVSGSPDSDVLLTAGTFAEDVALIGHLRKRPAAVGAVAAGRRPLFLVDGGVGGRESRSPQREG